MDLSYLDELWKNTQPAPPVGTQELLPEGQHVVTITKTVIDAAKSGTARLGLLLEAETGERAWTNMYITEGRMPYLKRDLAILGLHLTTGS